jgi:hypothetical protein
MATPKTDEAGIRQVIRALRAADHVIIGGHDGEDFFESPANETEANLIANLTACDSSTLHVRLPDGSNSHVFFVLGNDPEEVVCDYGVSLSPVIDPLTEGWWS